MEQTDTRTQILKWTLHMNVIVAIVLFKYGEVKIWYPVDFFKNWNIFYQFAALIDGIELRLAPCAK